MKFLILYLLSFMLFSAEMPQVSTVNPNSDVDINTNRDIDLEFMLIKNGNSEVYNEDSDVQYLTTRQLTGSRNLYKNTVPSVVLVVTEYGLGTGMIIDRNHILTNWHVVDGSEEAAIVQYDRKYTSLDKIQKYDVIEGTVAAIDMERDLALVRVDYNLNNPVIFGKYYNLDPAQDVFAIGHPSGGAFWSFGYGTISNIIEDEEWTYDGRVGHKASVIQTQTPINPGNSGGPLFDETGKVVGVNSSGNNAGSENINYSIRVDEVLDFILKAKKGHYPTNNAAKTICNEEKISDYDMASLKWNNKKPAQMFGCDQNIDKYTDELYIYVDNMDTYVKRWMDWNFNYKYDTVEEYDQDNNVWVRWYNEDEDDTWDWKGVDSGNGFEWEEIK